MLKEILLAGCGGFIGTAGRYLIGKGCTAIWHHPFPLATFLVNILGCFLIGLLFGLAEHTKLLTPSQNLLLVTGFCGGFTTFSTFANDIWVLGSKGDWTTSLLYLLLSVILGILAVCAGRLLLH